MTKYSEQDDAVAGRDGDCGDCPHWQLEGKSERVCTNCNSDHFGHVLAHYHRFCDERKTELLE